MKHFGKVAMPTEGLTVSGITFVVGPKSRGLSGEHIQLCAEGARLKPNLSGKRTEKIEHLPAMGFRQSSLEDCRIFVKGRYVLC